MQPATMSAPHYVEEWPDHTGLPDTDGLPAQSSLEHPQSNILTESFESRLRERHPDGRYFVGCDVGIYFDYTDPVLDGCRAPDWFYVPGAPPMLDGTFRRSLVMWKELVRPALLIEYVGGDGSEERDRTPGKGKFWIYEHAIGAGYYVIFDAWKRTLEVFCRQDDGYHSMSPKRGLSLPHRGLERRTGHLGRDVSQHDLPLAPRLGSPDRQNDTPAWGTIRERHHEAKEGPIAPRQADGGTGQDC